MELVWVLDFLELSRTGSFTEAAKGRHSSQPAFSRRIQALEAWAGVRLVDRAVSPVQLTLAGKAFLPVACQFIKANDLAKETLEKYRQTS
jgi:DNA-binding transcriptional LysR family regulator